MALFNIPQFIDIEDKIVGPLTAKQLGWLAAGGVVLLVLWSMLDMSAFIMAALIVGFIFGMLAFYRPNNQSLLVYILSVFSFFTKPKMYVWIRVPEIEKAKKKAAVKKTQAATAAPKGINENKIEEITDLLSKSNLKF